MNKFQKDLVLVDFEATGFDIEQDEPVQVGVLVLDKESLAEKASYVSWIKPNMQLTPDIPGLKWASIGQAEIAEINKARPLADIAKEIVAILPGRYTFCAWNASFDFYFWRRMLKTIGKDIRVAGILDLWTLAYVQLSNDPNYHQDGFKSELVFQYLGAKPRTKHDALEDCRIEAMVLRKLVGKS